MQIERIALHLAAVHAIDKVSLLFTVRDEIDIGAIGIPFQNPPTCSHIGGYIQVILFIGKNACLLVFCTEAKFVGTNAAVNGIVPIHLS